VGVNAGQADQGVDSVAIGRDAAKTSQGDNAIAIGYLAGQGSQGATTVAIGQNAGYNVQGANSVAMGYQAGYADQGTKSVALGIQAAQNQQGNSSVAIGNQAGIADQGNSSVAIGDRSGSDSQGNSSVAIGIFAGYGNQGGACTAVGQSAGTNAQGAQGTAIGTNSGQVSQGTYATAVGYLAGSNAQGISSVAMGHYAGRDDQGASSVAIGHFAGGQSQDVNAVAIGLNAGWNAQGSSSVAVGVASGNQNQGSGSVAVGNHAGYNSQGNEAVAMGHNSGKVDQGNEAVAIGYQAGSADQGSGSVAIGMSAAMHSQGTNSVAIGWYAAQNQQGSSSVAIGPFCGRHDQGIFSVAIGYDAGRDNQGNFCVAIGFTAGLTNQETGTFRVRKDSVRNVTGTEYLHINNSGEIVRGNPYSDDRLKYDEKFITGAVKSLFKLRPQEYLKKPKLIPNPDHDEQWKRESGLMAQEVYYSAPEMRHLVRVAEIAGDVDTLTPAPSDDPSQDPDYSVWGDKPSGIKYIQFIPYLIKGIQEIVTELPRSKTTVSNTWDQNITGLVVSAKMNTHKTNVTPIVTLSNVAMDKAWYGVVSDQKTDTNDYDTLVDINGDTRIWVSDVGGSLESGDLVTTSNIAPGYAQKQSDDIIRNYTVGKVTQECDFTEPLQVSVKIPKKELSNVKYYVKNMIREVELSEYEVYNSRHTTVETKPMYICEVQKGEPKDAMRFYRGGVEVSAQPGEDIIEKHFLEKTPDKYELLDDKKKAKYTLSTLNIYKVHSQTRSTRLIPEHEEEVFIEEMADVLDGNGQIVWEETDETEAIYTLVNHGTHKAALLTCKLD
jgi:hypothetical protein